MPQKSTGKLPKMPQVGRKKREVRDTLPSQALSDTDSNMESQTPPELPPPASASRQRISSAISGRRSPIAVHPPVSASQPSSLLPRRKDSSKSTFGTHPVACIRKLLRLS